nr:pitrilysin family protein [Acanthopleuribacter pedis]
MLCLVPLLAQLPKGITEVRNVEGITEYELENGLRVLLFPDPTKETITVNVTYLVGSKHENYGETGMAHLLEHLVFKGTPRHPNIPQELTERGARPNGTTWTDRTNYYETFNATEDNLDWALDLEADRMVNSFIAKKDLDSEMTVVRNEFESGENNPFRITLQRLLSAAYMWHNYGKSTIGARSDIENVPIDRLQAFYRKYYQPDNAVLLVAGKFETKKALDLVAKYFAPIPRPERVLPKIYTMEPTQDGTREITIERTGDIQMVAAGYHIPPGSHPEMAHMAVLTQILGDPDTGRLNKALVKSGKAAQSMGFNFQWAQPGIGIFGAVVPKDKSLEDARSTLIDQLETIKANPITEEELKTAKSELLRGIELAMNSSERIGLTMSEWIGMGDWRLFFLHRDRIEATTLEQVQAAAEKYLRGNNRSIAKFVPTESPERAEIPEVPNIEEMLKDYKGKEAVAMGEAFDPTPDNIEANLKRTSLKNGMKLALLSKKTRGESVHASLRLFFGDEKSLKDQGTLATTMGNMLMRGSKSMNRNEIQSKLAELKAEVTMFGGANNINVRIQTVRANLPATIQLVADVLKNPAFPESELEELTNQDVTNLESGRQEPRSIVFRELQRTFSTHEKGHPEYVGTIDETIAAHKAITTKDLASFHKKFVGASHGKMAVVGDFDKAEVTALLEKEFGSWKSPKKYKRLADNYRSVKPEVKKFETPDKANAVFVAGFNFDLKQEAADYPALVMGNFIMGGGFLNSRLATRIRQKEGLSYGVGSALQVDYLDSNAGWFTFAIAAPQNVPKLEEAFLEEVEKMVKEGVSEEELTAAISGYLQQQIVTRSNDARLVGRLSQYLEEDRTLAFDKTFEEQVRGLKPQSVNQVMKRYLKADNLTTIKGGDFAKAEEKEANN